MSSYPTFLCVEDDENFSFLFELAFKRSAIPNPLAQANDGAEAMEFLNQAREQHPPPCLIVTDLKMPGVDGFELLQWLQEHPELRHVPAVVLSTSDEERDRKRAMELGARAYYTKPSGLHNLTALIAELHLKWMAPRLVSQPEDQALASCPLADNV